MITRGQRNIFKVLAASSNRCDATEIAGQMLHYAVLENIVVMLREALRKVELNFTSQRFWPLQGMLNLAVRVSCNLSCHGVLRSNPVAIPDCYFHGSV